MTISQKLFWEVRNVAEYTWKKLNSSGDFRFGILSHREDKRDFEFLGSAVPQEAVSLDTGLRFNQLPFNICVFASRVLGRSMQDGIRYSVRWHVKLARKLGYIKGDGWSFLRAANEIGTKHGYLPYFYMPDETTGLSWEEYSKWTPEDDKLMEISMRFRVASYSQVKNKSSAVAALHAGQILFTAGKWYNGMNRPKAEKYLLLPLGGYIGGHAYCVSGYRNFADDFENPQTFGPDYGQNGKAWVDDIFGSNQYAIYIEEHLPNEVKNEHLFKEHDNKLIRTKDDPRVYLMKNKAFSYIESVEEMNTLLAERGVTQPTIVPNSFMQIVWNT